MVNLQTVEKRRATAFIVAGVLLFGFGTVNGIRAFTGLNPPLWTSDLFVAPGLIAGYVGLLGLYPRLRAQRPRLSKAGGAVIAVAMLAALPLFVVGLARSFLPSIEPVFFALYMVTLPATILGYLLFGVGFLSAADLSRTVGFALLGPPAVFVLMIATAPMNPPLWATFLVSLLQALAHLSIGLVLRRDPDPTNRGASSADPTP